jgi:hypothetical protein
MLHLTHIARLFKGVLVLNEVAAIIAVSALVMLGSMVRYLKVIFILGRVEPSASNFLVLELHILRDAV